MQRLYRYQCYNYVLLGWFVGESLLTGEAAKITAQMQHVRIEQDSGGSNIFKGLQGRQSKREILDELSAISLLEPAGALQDSSTLPSSLLESVRFVSSKRRGIPRKAYRAGYKQRKHPLDWDHEKGLWHWHHSDYVCLISFTLVAVLLNTIHSNGNCAEFKHNLLFLFAMITLSAVYCGMVRYLRNDMDAEAWFTGYVLESALSVDDVFVFHLVFCAFAVPEDQAQSALSVAIYAAIILRAAFVAFFAALFRVSYAVNIAVGALLIFGAIITMVGDAATLEVKDLYAVRFFKWILGSRLRDRYGSKGQMIEWSDKGYVQFNVLFLVVCTLIVVDAFSALDAIGSKTEEIDDTYINMSSSFMTMFTLRPLFFVIRGLASQCELVKYGISAILAFVGVQMIVMKWFPISLGWLAAVIIFIFSISVGFSALSFWLRGGSRPQQIRKEEAAPERKVLDEEHVFEDQPSHVDA